jgi:hypothetical protein
MSEIGVSGGIRIVGLNAASDRRNQNRVKRGRESL